MYREELIEQEPVQANVQPEKPAAAAAAAPAAPRRRDLMRMIVGKMVNKLLDTDIKVKDKDKNVKLVAAFDAFSDEVLNLAYLTELDERNPTNTDEYNVAHKRLSNCLRGDVSSLTTRTQCSLSHVVFETWTRQSSLWTPYPTILARRNGWRMACPHAWWCCVVAVVVRVGSQV